MHVHMAASLDTLNQFIQLQREYEIINIPRDFRAYHAHHRGCPRTFAVLKLKKKLWYRQSISNSNFIDSITAHSHTFNLLLWDPEGSPSKIAIKVYYEKSMGIKVMTQHFCQST